MILLVRQFCLKYGTCSKIRWLRIWEPTLKQVQESDTVLLDRRYQHLYLFRSSHCGIYLFVRNEEDQRGKGSCVWENPPENGFNFWPCSKGWCSDKAGSHKRNGTFRFTRCDSSYVLVEGSDGDTCVNGRWTSAGHRCIRKFNDST